MNASLKIAAAAVAGGLLLGTAGTVTAVALTGNSNPAAAAQTTAPPRPAPVKATPEPAKPRPAPTQTIIVQQPPKVIVTQPPAPAPVAPAGLRYVGDGVYAGPNTSDAFAVSVHQAYVEGGYWYQPGTSQFWVYSPVTGQSYLMTSSSVGNPVVVTGGDGALVQFSM